MPTEQAGMGRPAWMLSSQQQPTYQPAPSQACPALGRPEPDSFGWVSGRHQEKGTNQREKLAQGPCVGPGRSSSLFSIRLPPGSHPDPPSWAPERGLPVRNKKGKIGG